MPCSVFARLRRCSRPRFLATALAGCAESPATEAGFRASRRAHPARVTQHTDGDTLYLSGIGKVRLIGVDTPEVYGGVECFGRRASEFVERVAPLGSRVRYRLGVEERDRYGRALAYVWLRDGRAFSIGCWWRAGTPSRSRSRRTTSTPTSSCGAARDAREQERGLWRRPGCAG